MGQNKAAKHKSPRYIVCENGKGRAGDNRTVNEHLLEVFLAGIKPVFTIYEPSHAAIVLGAGRKVEADIILEHARADDIPILRRKGGGGTVVLSPGQVVLALVTRVGLPFNNLVYAQWINSWVREALSSLGVKNVEDRGITDLAIGNRKILGASLYRRRLILFYQSGLLVNNDISLFSRYLTYPSKSPDYRKDRNHSDFCTTLNRAGFSLSVEQVIQALKVIVRRNLASLV